MQTKPSSPLLSSEEKNIERILGKLPFGFSIVTASYVMEYANDAWLKLLQKTEEEVLGKRVFDVFPGTEEQLFSLFENVKSSRQPLHAPEYCLPLIRDGKNQETYFNFAYHPTYSDAGEFQYFACIAVEVTDLVRIKNKIKNEEERLRLATESSLTATWDLNLKTSEIIHSPSLSKIFGYADSDAISHSLLRQHLMAEDRTNIVDKAFERAKQTGIYQYEARIIDKNGTEKWIATHGKIFCDEAGAPTRMLGVLQDITERKTHEILLQMSHHQLNTAMDATKLGTFDMNAQTQEKYNFSPRFYEIFGYDPETERIDSRVLEKHIDPSFVNIRKEALRRAAETGDLFYQSRIILRDGTSRWIEFYGRLMKPIQGREAYICGTVRDITEHKDFEKRTSESESKYRFLADAMPQIVWLGESDGKLVYFNQATMDYSGKNYNEFLEQDGWIDIVHPDEKAENVRMWQQCVEEKTPFIFEHRFRHKSGAYRWFLSRAYPQLDETGHANRWVGTSTDIDDMKRLDAHKNDFIKIANHELKTPVTTIKGYVQLLKKMRASSDDMFLMNSLNTIENQVNKLNVLIGDMLDISRIESGTLPLNRNRFSLLELVTETIEDIKASEQSHEINFELDHDSDIEVSADKDRITQVLSNLLTNAIKYSPNAKQVDVTLREKYGSAVVCVQDFGIGMEQEELTRIFDRFYRVSGADEVTFPGFGIGLYIVRDIMERHGGKIWVESKKNVGSTFYFSLPVLD